MCSKCGLDRTSDDYRVHRLGHRVRQCRLCEREYQKEQTRKDPEKYRARKQESMARRRAADVEAARAYGRAYHAANRERQNGIMRDYAARRFFWSRFVKLRGRDKATPQDLARLWKKQQGRCRLTGRRMGRDAHLDHIVPKARGGDDSAANLRWLCPEANYAKRDLSDESFIALCEDVLKYFGSRSDLSK
jgi:5-methylcytosine-specific restriction endonuclease McrA